MSVQLDPRKAHKAHIVGDIMVILTWVNDERAMVFMPAHREQGSPWFIICESAAWKYDNPHYLAKQSVQAARVMRMDETTSTWRRVADIIMNYLPDLIRMPAAPEPEKLDSAIGTVSLRADGELLHSEDIKIDKPVLEYESA